MVNTSISTTTLLDTRIPAEIWGSIFIAALPGPSSWILPEKLPSQPFFMTPHLIPLVLSAVCRSWRQIACSQPRLWDSCLLSYKHPEFNEIWLNRSGRRALTLVAHPVEGVRYPWFRMEDDVGEHLGNAIVAFARSILPYQQRWLSVKIHMRPFFWWTAPRLHFQVSQGSSPLLEVFEVTAATPKCRLCSLHPWLTSAFSNAPSLRRLELGYIDEVKSLRLQLPSLVELQIKKVRVDDALRMLLASPNLQTLRLSTAFFERVVMDRLAMITHTNLVNIWLHEDDFCDTFEQGDDEDAPRRSMLTRLVLPSLCNACIYGVPTDALLSLLDRSCCSLTMLSFDGDWLDLHDLLSLLEDPLLSSQIQSLELKGFSCDDSLLQFLEFDPKQPHLQHLEELSFKDCVFRHIHPSPLADILQSRNAGFNTATHTFLPRSSALLRKFSADVLGLLPNLSLLDIARLIPLPGPRDITGHSCSIELKIQLYVSSRDIVPMTYVVGRELPDCDI